MDDDRLEETTGETGANALTNPMMDKENKMMAFMVDYFSRW